MYTDETVLVLNNPTSFQIFDRNHIPSCTSAGSVLQLCKVSFKSNEPFRRSCCAYKPISPYFNLYFHEKKEGMYLVSATPPKHFIGFYETLHSCNTLPADVHEEI
jgi:hypothetical protein